VELGLRWKGFGGIDFCSSPTQAGTHVCCTPAPPSASWPRALHARKLGCHRAGGAVRLHAKVLCRSKSNTERLD
jgi:hypothetical protein